MNNVNNHKLDARTFAVSLISAGLASGISVLVTDSVGKTLSILFGIGFFLIVLLGFHKRISGYFRRIGGSGLMNFLAVFMPLGGLLIFVLYPIAVGTITSLGIAFDTSIIVIAIVSGLLAIANLVVLIMNISSLLHRPKVSNE